MPFAALKGYHELAASKERVPEPRREVTEEQALALSQAITALRKGDTVRVTHYEDGCYVQTVGAVSEVVEPLRFLRVIHKPIHFDDIFSLAPLS